MVNAEEELLKEIKRMEKDFYDNNNQISGWWQDHFVHNLCMDMEDININFKEIEKYVENPTGAFVNAFKRVILSMKI